MTNQVLGWGMIITVGISFLLGMIGNEEEGTLILLGIAIMFFGIWGGIRLIKSK